MRRSLICWVRLFTAVESLGKDIKQASGKTLKTRVWAIVSWDGRFLRSHLNCFISNLRVEIVASVPLQLCGHAGI